MIWVLAGTGDSFKIISELQERTNAIIVSVVTEYGEQLLGNGNIRVIKKELNKNDMQDLIIKNNIKLIIDGTHPFAKTVSENAIKVSQLLDVTYLRYEREMIDLSVYPDEFILAADGYKKAVKIADQFQNIFLTIGSNNLNYFVEGIEDWQERLTARILPDWRFIKKARNLGFTPANLLALQGPFSRRLNRVLLEEYKADVLVSKASGSIGGVDTKIKAALDLNLPIIVIKRPILSYPRIFSDIDNLIDYCFKRREWKDA